MTASKSVNEGVRVAHLPGGRCRVNPHIGVRLHRRRRAGHRPDGLSISTDFNPARRSVLFIHRLGVSLGMQGNCLRNHRPRPALYLLPPPKGYSFQPRRTSGLFFGASSTRLIPRRQGAHAATTAASALLRGSNFSRAARCHIDPARRAAALRASGQARFFAIARHAHPSCDISLPV